MERGWSWVVLLGAFIINFLTFGYLQCIGIFLVDWQEEFDASVQKVGWSSAILIGGFGSAGPLSSALSSHLSCRGLTFLGGIVTCAALVCVNFVTHLPHLFIVMAFAGFGLGLAFLGSLVVVGYYFDKRIGLATGVGLSGVGIGVFALAPLTRYLVDQYSWRGAMTIEAALFTNVCVCGALFRPTRMEESIMKGLPLPCPETPSKTDEKSVESSEEEGKEPEERNGHIRLNTTPIGGRVRLSRTESIREHISWSQRVCIVLRAYKNMFSIRFAVVCLSCAFLTGLGYYSAVVYYVANAISKGISKTDAAILLSILGISSTCGRVGYGPFIDRGVIAPLRLAGLMQAIAGTSCLLGQLASSYTSLVVFSVVLGVSTGSNNALFPIVVREVVGVENMKRALGIVVVTWNVGGLVGLPLIGYVCDSTGAYAIVFYIAGSVMVLNSLLFLLDPLWRAINKRMIH